MTRKRTPSKKRAPQKKQVTWRKVAERAVGKKEVARRERAARRRQIEQAKERGMAIRGGSLTKRIKAQLEDEGFTVVRESYWLEKGAVKFPGLWDRYCIDLHETFDKDNFSIEIVLDPIRMILESVYAGQPATIKLGMSFVNDKKEVEDGWRQLTKTTDIRTTFTQAPGKIDDFATESSYLEFDKVCIDVRRIPA